MPTGRTVARRGLFALLGVVVAVPCVLVAAGGPGGESVAAGGTLSEPRTVRHGGHVRTFRVYTPGGTHAGPRPAALLLHGHGGSADQLLGVGGRTAPYRAWLPVADRAGVVLVVPDGLVGPDGKRGWNDARALPDNPAADDVGFLVALLGHVAESQPVDAARTYAAGTSNGGHMALRLAAEAPDAFAAVAAVAAANPDPPFAPPPDGGSPAGPGRPVSVLLMNGTDDAILPYGGGRMARGRGRVQSAAATAEFWAARNGCTDEAPAVTFPDRTPADGCTASRRTWRAPAGGAEVSLVTVAGGGHAEPSVSQPYPRWFRALVGRQNRDVEMAEETWRFFRDKPAPP